MRVVAAMLCIGALWSGAAGPATAADPPNGEGLLRLNHFQGAGTHNSYHRRPLLPTHLIEATWNYEHPPLEHQLFAEGIRQLELDVHWNPQTRSFEVFHRRFLDDRTWCRALRTCLSILRTWSDAHPTHHPVFVLIQPTDAYEDVTSNLRIGLLNYSIVGHYDALDAEIRAVMLAGRDRLLTPDEVQGDAPTLRSAVLDRGWPLVDDVRGQFVFLFLDFEHHRDNYVLEGPGGQPSLKGRAMFVHGSGPYISLESIYVFDDPTNVGVASRVEQGFIVRVNPTPDQYERALDIGAHLISTDHPYPRCDPGGPCLRIPGGTPLRCNPVSAPASCRPERLEYLGS
jgi:hypothetical protein